MADDVLHRPGTPCWVILATPDAERTGPFYAGLFGWSAPPAGGFATMTSGGRDVATVLPPPPEAGAASRPVVFLAPRDLGLPPAPGAPAGRQSPPPPRFGRCPGQE